MNKSDILKAAEEADEWLGCEPKPQDYHSRHAYKEALKQWENCEIDNIQLAQSLCKAAELLKQVEVLPEGSEPMVGDMITWTSNAGKKWEEKHCEIYNPKSREIGFWSHLLEENCKPQIIQRVGKPVIIEKEGV